MRFVGLASMTAAVTEEARGEGEGGGGEEEEEEEDCNEESSLSALSNTDRSSVNSFPESQECVKRDLTHSQKRPIILLLYILTLVREELAI